MSQQPVLVGVSPRPRSGPRCVGACDEAAVRRHEIRLRLLHRKGDRLTKLARRFDRTCARFSRVRLALAIALAGATSAALTTDVLVAQGAATAVAVGTLISFLVVARRHSQALDGLRRLEVWERLRREQVSRLVRDWEGLPPPFDDAGPGDHPFGADLQIVGARSVHHLVSLAVTEGGARRLAEWLLSESPDSGEIARRRRLVAALVARPRFRDRLPLSGRTGPSPVDLSALTSWLGRSPSESPRRALIRVSSLSALTYVLLALWLGGLVSQVWLLSLGLYFAVYLAQARRIEGLSDRADDLATALRSASAMFEFVESSPQRGSPALSELCAPFWEGSARPSGLLRAARRVADAATYQRSGVLWVVLNTLGPWDLFFAHRLERLRQVLSDVAPQWLDAWATLEAAASLAQFADLEGRPLASEVEPGGAVFEAQRLVHPLLPATEAVPNSIRFESVGEALVVTGSNMAGKSTFLRALGANLALAQAGGPVTAEALTAVPFRIVAVLNVGDSVQDGVSYFYAEVRRLKALLDAVEGSGAPVFFLIDEILRGTNNRERLRGSRAYVRALAQSRSAVGLLSTHDLDLARLDVAGFSNVHFRDAIEGGRMTFDYTLREGSSETTNALRVLESAGLPTELE